MTTLVDMPAIAGGKPAFAQKLPILSPEGIGAFEVRDAFDAVLQSKMLTNGTQVRAFEQAAGEYLGVEHCVAVSSCSAGLLLVMRALGLQGEVILPSFTFHMTAHAATWNGLPPVFADCELDSFCLSPAAVREKLTERTAAILAVHMYGHPAEVEALEAIANERGIPLLFDAAHAFGSEFAGKRMGGFGTAEVFSFSPTKLLVAAEGGLITMRDAALARLLRAGRNYGDAGNYDPDMAGFNARMSELHGALVLRGLPTLGERLLRRNQIRLRYERNLSAVPGLTFQGIRPRCVTTCKDFSILVDAERFGAPREWLFEALTKENIEVKRYFWPPVHRQKLYRDFWDGQPLPATDQISDNVISLPIYSTLPDDSVDRVCEAIARAQAFAQKNGSGRRA